MSHPSQISNDWRTGSPPSLGFSLPPVPANRTYSSRPRPTHPSSSRALLDRDWRDRSSPPSQEAPSDRLASTAESPSRSPSASPPNCPATSTTSSSSYLECTDKRNTPYAFHRFEILPIHSPTFTTYHLNGADKEPDFESQLAFAIHRIKQRGSPRVKGKEAVQARIHDWWHPSDNGDDKVEHLTIEYSCDPDKPWIPVELGGGIYSRLHVYRTDEDECESQRRPHEQQPRKSIW